MSKTECKVTEQLSAYIDGHMNGQQVREIARHLTDCETCSNTITGLRKVRSLLGAVNTPSVPPQTEFWSNAYRTARLKAREPRSPATIGIPSFLKRRVLVFSFSFALCCALLLPFTNIVQQMTSLRPQTSNLRVSVIDIAPLIRAHTSYAAVQPLVDDSHVSMILSDEAAAKENLPADDQTNVTSP